MPSDSANIVQRHGINTVNLKKGVTNTLTLPMHMIICEVI